MFSFPLQQTYKESLSGIFGKNIISFSGEGKRRWRGEVPKSHFKISAGKKDRRQKFPKQPHKASFMDSNMLGIKPS